VASRLCPAAQPSHARRQLRAPLAPVDCVDHRRSATLRLRTTATLPRARQRLRRRLPLGAAGAATAGARVFWGGELWRAPMCRGGVFTCSCMPVSELTMPIDLYDGRHGPDSFAILERRVRSRRCGFQRSLQTNANRYRRRLDAGSSSRRKNIMWASSPDWARLPALRHRPDTRTLDTKPYVHTAPAI